MIKSPKEAYEYAYNNGLVFPADWQVTKNFTWNEVFKNETKADGLPIFEVFQNAFRLAQHLQKIRERLGKPVNVHCWVRQIPHNKRAKSTAKYSGHINGCACDFDVAGVSDSGARTIILGMGLPIRVEANTVGWVHVDINSYVYPFKAGLFYI